ncbi:hypothetical protein Tco_0804182 [Tanacetum coccineum]|uniref:Uncharacterized protein n=1 Tax=Tanacetum coccineum TaxID=301880 RepID=A0ABQ5A3M1_9ASTR
MEGQPGGWRANWVAGGPDGWLEGQTSGWSLAGGQPGGSLHPGNIPNFNILQKSIGGGNRQYTPRFYDLYDLGASRQIEEGSQPLRVLKDFATGEINKLTGGKGTRNRGGSGLQYGRLTKFEFPKLVFMHMFDKALNWHKQFIRKYGENVEWTVYEREVQKRFDSVFEDPIVELKILKHVTTVQLGMTYLPKTTTTTLALPAPPNSGTNNSEDYGLEELLEEQVVQNFGESIVEAPLISLHAMNGESTYKTIRVKDCVGKHTVHSLIDSSNIHTFLDLRVAKKLGCKLKATCLMDVSVNNGQIISCEMVLGVQWLSILGDIKWNFKYLVMDFVYNNKRMVLRGTQKAKLQWMYGKRHPKEAKSLQTDHVETDASGMGIRAVLQQGYDYEIFYKKGSENTAADALSKISSGFELCSLILSIITSDLLQQIKNSWVADVDLQLLIKQIEDSTYTGTKYT